MNPNFREKKRSRPVRRGFTLVEMLVATALVVLMMLLFAQVFQTSAGLISNQKGMAEHDQAVRSVTILLRGDIAQRTFRDVIPFYPGQVTENVPNYDASRRRGFISISENNADDVTDDVLHLTITSDATDEDGGSPRLPFSGRASLMFNGTTPTDLDDYLRAHPDQPEFDDGQLSINNTGSSRYAEVCWFLRNGTLYRRQLLIREPYNRNGNATEEPQDSSATPTPFIDIAYDGEEHVDATTNPTGVFWRDFDYSAYWEPDTQMQGTAYGLKFHTPESLDNRNDSSLAVANLLDMPRSLGIPFLRYGSSVSRATDGGSGLQIFGPREYLDNTDLSTYIGRYTIEESTHQNFAYPGNSTLATDPFNSNGPTLNLQNGKVAQYQFTNDSHQRRGEDIVMTNVHSFDIQVWDDLLRRFVNLGDGSGGRYDATANSDYENRYDTWHPFAGMPVPPYPNPFPRDMAGNLPVLGSADEVPLKAIRIFIRFYDVGSDTMRDLTFTFPLVD